MKWVLILGLSAYAIGNLYVYVRLLQGVAHLPLWAKICGSLLFWLCATALFSAFALHDAGLSERILRTLYVVGSWWMVFTLYMCLTLLTTDVIHLVVPALSGRVWWALGITLLLLVGGYLNYRLPRTQHLGIEVDKPIAKERVRLAVISDIHLGYGTDREDLARYIELINGQSPDAVLIVGDLIDNSVRPVEAEDMCAEFSRVCAPAGVYMVAGNHEYISDIEAVEAYLANSAVRLLRDSVVTLPSDIVLVGRDDRANSERAPLAELLASADSSRPIVVLDHQPYDIEESAAAGCVDIHLSGHTHRGQVWPLSLLVDALYEQSYGYRRWGDMHAYVTSGLSLWGPPFRIGTNSELVIIDITSSANTATR